MKIYRKPSDKVLVKMLDEISYRVTQCNAEEKPFSSIHNRNYQEGIYVDIVTKEPLFSSRCKLFTNCGWPSFSAAISDDAVREFTHNICGFKFVEVRSKFGNSHLGHLFNDGPKEAGGMRYCINGAALKFVAKEDLLKEGYGEYLSFFH